MRNEKRNKRNNYRDHIKTKGDIEMSEFSVVMMHIYDEEDLLNNGGFHHPTYKGKLFIKKDDQTIILEGDEINQVVKTSGGNFRR